MDIKTPLVALSAAPLTLAAPACSDDDDNGDLTDVDITIDDTGGGTATTGQ